MTRQRKSTTMGLQHLIPAESSGASNPSSSASSLASTSSATTTDSYPSGDTESEYEVDIDLSPPHWSEETLIQDIDDFLPFPNDFLQGLIMVLKLPYTMITIATGLLGVMLKTKIQVIRPGGDSEMSFASKERAEYGGTVSQWVEKNVGSLKGVYRPSWWLPNGHFQTIYCVVGNFNKVDPISYQRTYLRVPDGGTLGLDIAPLDHASLPEGTPTLVVCHGLTGGSHESYVRNVLTWATKPVSEGGGGVRGVVVNFRGCAGVPITSPRLYSAGNTADLTTSINYLRSAFPKSPLHGIGFSLGSSVLARHMGETSSDCLLSSAIVLGCPWDLRKMSHTLETGLLNRYVYSTAMAKNLLTFFFSHHDRNPDLFLKGSPRLQQMIDDLVEMRKGKFGKRITLRAVDDKMTSILLGYAGADEYYTTETARYFVTSIKRPVLSINAADDPIVEGRCLPFEEFKKSSHVYSVQTPYGGHLGWFDGPFFDDIASRSRWIIKPVTEFFTAAFRDIPQEGGEVVLDTDAKSGFTWAKGVRQVQGGGRVGWRVLGDEEVEGVGESGTLQGL